MARWLVAIAAILLGACAGPAVPAAEPIVGEPELAAIEHRTGGRLGVALVDSEGRLVVSRRADERFAMCSTFKLPLAAMVLASGISPRTPLPATEADLLSHSPYSERTIRAGRRIRVGFAARAIVEQSDNTAANLLLRRMGGPEAFTAWLRRTGDETTRLDRYELELNENAPGDARDTTSPVAIARTTAGIVYGDLLTPAYREQLRSWTTASRTGVRRVRAGLLAEWPAGDKTGSCGTAWNDVAWFEVPDGAKLVLAVYLDRPTVPAGEAEAAIAEVARLIASRLL